jgi:hypothetical protein
VFEFGKNEFFSETVLRKRYVQHDDEDGESILDKAEGTTITWTPGKNLTQKMVTKKQRHKSVFCL